MPSYNTEEIRDNFGKITAIRVKLFDALGREYYVDVVPADAVSIQLNVLLDAVAVQAAPIVSAMVVAPKAQVLTRAQVQDIAKGKKK